MMRKCHKNTCPVGIATQDPRLRKKFMGSPDDVVNYFRFVAEKVREIMASLGFSTLNELIGRTDMLETDPEAVNWKDSGLDLSPVLMPARKPYPEAAVYCTRRQDHALETVLDRQILIDAESAISGAEDLELAYPIQNTDRTVGTIMSSVIASRYGNAGLPEGRLTVAFNGSAGQSFGAWLISGVTFHLTGDANDYVGKGLSGGTLVIAPPLEMVSPAEENVIIGNVSFYGATSGRAFIRGLGAERFCVRNSGAEVVIEGVGDHGCEYMTGGRAIILGRTGRNFAAGMSGGIAYVYDPDDLLPGLVNSELVDLERPDADEEGYLRSMVAEHRDRTGSRRAEELLGDFDGALSCFVKVMPRDYKEVLNRRKAEEKLEAVHG